MGLVWRRWQGLLGALVFLAGPLAQAGQEARLVVVPSEASVQPRTLAQFTDEVAAGIAAKHPLVATAQYRDAAKLARLGPRAGSGSGSAVLIGGQVGASHALFLRLTAETVTVGARKKRSRERLTVAAILVDTATGESLLSRRYLAGGRGLLRSDMAPKLLADVEDALSTQRGGAVAAAPRGPAAVPAKAEDAHKAAAEAPSLATPPPAPAVPAPVPAPAPGVPAKRAHPPAAPAAAPAEPAAEAGRLAAAPGPRPALERGLRAELGFALYGRQAQLTTSAGAAMQYGFEHTAPGPLFSRGTLKVSAFPILWARHNRARRFYEGVGVHFAGSVGWPRTQVAANTVATHVVGHVRGGLTLRLPFTHGPLSPDVALLIGGDRYAFALPAGTPFPSLSYTAAHIGLSTEIPLGTRHVALTAEGAILPSPKVGDEGPLLGGRRNRSLGATVEAGLRITPIAHLDLLLLFDWAYFQAQYAGSTLLPQATQQFANVVLRDTLLGGRVAVGTTF